MAPIAIFGILAVVLVARVYGTKPQKIVNGLPVTPGEFPYQVSLRVINQHFCGGTIVSPYHIVTAAHCVIDLTVPMTVVTGTIFSTAGEHHKPKKIDCHPRFSYSKFSPFDIAVITLKDGITFNAYQNKIALPTAPAPIGVMATTTGWGYIRSLFLMVPPELNKIQLPTISKKDCKKKFGPGIPIYANQICTNNPFGSGICIGDSGGPLAFNNSLIGVASWSIRCAVGIPDVFTSIYHHLSWLSSIINA